MRRGGRGWGGRNRWCPGPASGPLIRIGSVRISSDRCKHTSETACFLARFARLGGKGGGSRGGGESTDRGGGDAKGVAGGGGPRGPGAPPPPISGRAGGQGLTRGPRARRLSRPRRTGAAEGGRLAAPAARLRREGRWASGRAGASAAAFVSAAPARVPEPHTSGEG